MSLQMRKKLSEHFTLGEFVKQDLKGWKQLGDETRGLLMERLTLLADELEVLRTHIGGPILITSGWRSAIHNRSVGGSPTSDHPRGFGCDIQRTGLKPQYVFERARFLHSHGLMHVDQGILYPTHVHIGIGPRRRGQFFVSQ